jgi:hypothetical protein
MPMLLDEFANQLGLPASSNPRHHDYLGPGFDGTVLVEHRALHKARCFLSFNVMRGKRRESRRINLGTTRMSCTLLVDD